MGKTKIIDCDVDISFRQKLGDGVYCFDVIITSRDTGSKDNLGVIFAHLKKDATMTDIVKYSQLICNPEELRDGLKEKALETARIIDEFIQE